MVRYCVTLVIFAIAINNILSGSVPFQDCGSLYNLKDVDIDDCNKDPCVLSGAERNISMKIIAKSPSKNLHHFVELVLRGLHIKLSVTPEDACKSVKCPVVQENDASFTAAMDLTNEDIPPYIDGKLSWKITNEKNVQILCMQTNILIKNFRKPLLYN